MYPQSETAELRTWEGTRRVDKLQLDLHGHSVGAAQTRAAMWLLELKAMMGRGKVTHRALALVPGKGYGKQLVKNLIAKEPVGSKIYVYADDKAWEFYDKQGFVKDTSATRIEDCTAMVITCGDEDFTLPTNRFVIEAYKFSPANTAELTAPEEEDEEEEEEEEAASVDDPDSESNSASNLAREGGSDSKERPPPTARKGKANGETTKTTTKGNRNNKHSDKRKANHSKTTDQHCKKYGYVDIHGVDKIEGETRSCAHGQCTT